MSDFTAAAAVAQLAQDFRHKLAALQEWNQPKQWNRLPRVAYCVLPWSILDVEIPV